MNKSGGGDTQGELAQSSPRPPPDDDDASRGIRFEWSQL